MSTQYALGIGFFVPFVASEIASSIVITWLYMKTGGSVLIAGVVYHLTWDTSSTALIDSTLDEMLGGKELPLVDDTLLVLVFAIHVLVALVVVALTRGRLGYSTAVESDG